MSECVVVMMQAMPRKRRPCPVRPEPSGSDGDECPLSSGPGPGPGPGSGPGSGQAPQRNAANARERARMRVLSRAFCRLKTTLPWVPPDTKLSKLDTLRLATSYIAHLRSVLTDQPLPNDGRHQKHPLALTWPFSFHQSVPGIVSSYDAGSCWNNVQDSGDDSENMSEEHMQSQDSGPIRDFAPYYQQYTDSLMQIQ